MKINKIYPLIQEKVTFGSQATVLGHVLFIIVSLFCGVLIGMGQGLVVMLLMGVIVSVAMLAYPIPLLWVVLLGVFVVSGPVELYFPELRPVRWGVSMLGFALIASALMGRLFLAESTTRCRIQPCSTLTWLGVFFAVALAGLLYARRMEGLIGLKTYFQACGFFLTLAWIPISRDRGDRIIKALVFIALIQLPFALHQFFFLGSRRLAASSGAIVADGVVGTFSGSVSSGGAGPVLSALLILVISIILYWWRNGKISTFKTIFMVLFCLIPIFLNETKISLLAIPIGLYFVFSDKLNKNPLQFLTGALITIIFLAGMFMVYVNLPAGSAYGPADPTRLFEDTVAYNIGDKGYGSAELNRTTIYIFWAKNHGLSNPIETLIGHGLGSSGEAVRSEATNLASTVYRGKGIGLTSISSLLWDVGLLGTLAVVAMFWSAFSLAGKILENSRGGDVAGDGLLMGAKVGIAVLALNLIHNNYFTFEFGYQSMLMLMFGYIVYRARSQAIEKTEISANELIRR